MLVTHHIWSLLSVITLTSAGRPPRIEPLPTCKECVPLEDIRAPGIGIHLTPSYCTAAIRYNNGSVQNLGKIDAPKAYSDLMLRWSNTSSPSQGSCTCSYWREAPCCLAQAKRRINKLLGRPATPDVGTIATFLTQIHSHLSLILGPHYPHSTTRLLPTLPTLPPIPWQDLTDAMQYAGLSPLVTHKHIGATVSELSAAFAGTGQGLCRHYADVSACEQEEADMRTSVILQISYSHRSFSAAYTYLESAYRSINENEVVDFNLGFDKLPSHPPARTLYWERMRNAIVDVGRASPYPFTHLLLLGDATADREFREMVEDALRELVPSDWAKVKVLPRAGAGDGEGVDPVYVAARGAAEFAKRALGAPPGCREPRRCKEERAAQGMNVDVGEKSKPGFEGEL